MEKDSSAESKYKTVVKWMIIFLPVVWGLFSVYRNGVNVFFYDEWEYAFHIKDFWTAQYLWGQHNEHRMFFPKIITGIVGELTGWNSKAFMYVSQVFLALYYLTIIRVLLGDKSISKIDWKRTIGAFILGMTVYNSCQYENLLWGFQIAWIMIASLGFLSFYFYAKYLNSIDGIKYLYFAFAVFLAVVISFSSLHGLAVWAGYVGCMIINHIRKKSSVGSEIIIGIAAVLCFIAYFRSFEFVERHSEMYMKNLWDGTLFFLSCIGSVMWSFHISFICVLIGGLTLLLLAIAIIVFRHDEQIVVMCVIGPFLMGCVALWMIVVGRANEYQTIPSRYTTVSTMVIISFILVIFLLLNQMVDYDMYRGRLGNAFKDRAKEMTINSLIISGMIVPVLILGNNVRCSEIMSRVKEGREKNQIVALNYRYSTSDDLRSIYSVGPETYKKFVDVISDLDKEGYNVFNDKEEILRERGCAINEETVLGGLSPQKDEGSLFTIDEIAGYPFSNKNSLRNLNECFVKGWLQIDDIAEKECFLRLGDELYRLNWVDRPDVNEFFNSGDYSGFEGEIIPIGNTGTEYKMALVVVDTIKGSFVEHEMGQIATIE